MKLTKQTLLITVIALASLLGFQSLQFNFVSENPWVAVTSGPNTKKEEQPNNGVKNEIALKATFKYKYSKIKTSEWNGMYFLDNNDKEIYNFGIRRDITQFLKEAVDSEPKNMVSLIDETTKTTFYVPSKGGSRFQIDFQNDWVTSRLIKFYSEAGSHYIEFEKERNELKIVVVFGRKIEIAFNPYVVTNNLFEVAAFEFYLDKINFKSYSISEEWISMKTRMKKVMRSFLCNNDPKYIYEKDYKFEELSYDDFKAINKKTDNLKVVDDKLDEELRDYICGLQPQKRRVFKK
jgi:hypothetical protein